jgi:hypothetical protein
VLSRDEKGGEQSVKVHDFVVVKASHSLHEDRVLAILEVKRVGMTVEAAHEQLSSYFGALVDKGRFGSGDPLFDRLDGLLVIGNEVKLVTLPTPGGLLEFLPLHNITSATVHVFLRGIAVSNW